ncbi:mechanosensitive ion channel family protein [Galbitalea sp. SE-J8]|uniref:mechanosensitive ion channel family protein n=1 Tax=Galbitalea sp. SE-J8 TaxID=3054952 RepID=UPI00259CB7D7|nr:mechanosensitive ion channel family protein [Galbitalea sp. SE-J8]MDM4762251.1 mechanosensitive ion channel family protein [Galbitalea sp. SE-J8]
MRHDWDRWIASGITVGTALLIAIVVMIVVAVIARRAARRHDGAAAFVSSARHPFRFLLVVVAVWIAIAVRPLPLDRDWRDGIAHALVIAVLVLAAWFVSAVVGALLNRLMGRYRTDVRDNRVARRAKTQIAIVRRLIMVVIWLIAIAAALLTFPEVQAVGTSLLASAGVVSIVAGLAAQSTLANVIAGLQIAFTDAVRVDDVVIVETEWGKIEEITLTYVVVHIWDDRRMVLPSTYFTTTPFQNWTRRSSELLGSVEFDVDWRVSPSEMRRRLDEVLAGTELWDGRAKVLQVTDAVGGSVRIRVLLTAQDAPTLFDLRCLVREQLVEWLHTTDAAALPLTRVQLVEERARAADSAPARRRGPSTDTGGLFTGSAEAEERAQTFTSAIPLPDTQGTPDEPPAR